MADLPKLEELNGKITFKSNDEYNAVTQQYIEKEGDVNTIQRLLNRDNVAITEAAPAPAPAEEAAAAPVAGEAPVAAPVQSSATSTLVDKLKKKAELEGINLEYKTDDEIIEAMLTREKRVSYLEREMDGLRGKADLSNQERAELTKIRADLAKLQTSTVAPQAAPAAAPAAALKSKKDEIDLVRAKLSVIEDPLSAPGLALNQQLMGLMLEEQDMLRSQLATAGSGNAELQALQKQMLEMNNRLMQSEQLAKTERDNISIQNERAKEMQQIERFQSKIKNFSTKKTMNELDSDYIKWAKELYHLQTGSYSENPADWKPAVDAFLNHDAELGAKAKRAAVQMPAEVDKYLEICDLLRLRNTLNNATGDDHTLEQVMIYKMGRTGTIDDAMSQQRALGAEAIINAQTKRDVEHAAQLGQSSGASPENISGETMTVEEAKGILASISPKDALVDPKKGALYDRATAVLTNQRK